MKVKGFLKDVGGASRVTKLRRETIQTASNIPDPKDPIRALADALHPGPESYRLVSVKDASPTARTFRFEPLGGHVPAFQAGQYACFYFTIGQSVVTRAYSISSAPYEARLEKPYFEITVRKNRPYFVPDYLFSEVKIGDEVRVDLPFSAFHVDAVRDSKTIMGLAGGSGITPFLSMAREIAHGTLDADLTILYGSVQHGDIVCGEELDRIAAACPRVKIVNIMSDDPDWDGEKGFVTEELIRKYSKGDVTYFFCGPWPMFFLVQKALQNMGVPEQRFRHEAMMQPANVKQIPGFPEEQVGKTHKITVVRGIHKDIIDARADEPVAVSLERAGIPIDAHCRGGECGYCRAQLLGGNIFVSPLGDGRRRMDKEMGWFHSCSAFPMSDITIKIPIL